MPPLHRLEYQRAKAVFFMEYNPHSNPVQREHKKEEKAPRPHSLTLRDRGELEADGVEEVVSFDEGAISAKTSRGEMTVEGKGLRILGFDAAEGRLRIKGEVDSVCYQERKERRRGFFGK